MNLFQATAFPFANAHPAQTWAGLKMPVLRMDVLFEMHRKNAAALADANEIVFEGLTRLAQRQGELLASAVNDYTKVAYGVLTGGSFEERSTNQIDAARHIYGSSVTRLQEVADIAVKTNSAAVGVLSARISEAFDEFGALFSTPVAPTAALTVATSPAVAEPVAVVEEAAVGDALTLEKSEATVSPPSKKATRSRKTTRRRPTERG